MVDNGPKALPVAPVHDRVAGAFVVLVFGAQGHLGARRAVVMTECFILITKCFVLIAK